MFDRADEAGRRVQGHAAAAAVRVRAGWLASLALYKCRAFGPRFLTGYYFKPGGGVLTRQD